MMIAVRASNTGIANGTDCAVGLPIVAVGDLLVVVLDIGSRTTVLAPLGWDRHHHIMASCPVAVFSKIADGSELEWSFRLGKVTAPTSWSIVALQDASRLVVGASAVNPPEAAGAFAPINLDGLVFNQNDQLLYIASSPAADIPGQTIAGWDNPAGLDLVANSDTHAVFLGDRPQTDSSAVAGGKINATIVGVHPVYQQLFVVVASTPQDAQFSKQAASAGLAVYQYNVSVLYTSTVTPQVFVTQQAVEVSANYVTNVRVSQQGLEVLRSLAGTKTHSADLGRRATTAITTSASALTIQTKIITHSTDTHSVHARLFSHSADTRAVHTSSQHHSTMTVPVDTSALAQTATFLVVETSTRAHTALASVVHTSTINHTAGSFLRRTATTSHSANAGLKYVQTLAQGTDTTTVHVTALAHSAGFLLLQTSTRTHGADHLVLQTSTPAHRADFAIENFKLLVHQADHFLLQTSIKTHGTDSKIILISTLPHDADALVLKQSTLKHFTNSTVKNTKTKAHFASTAAVHTNSVTAQADTFALHISTVAHTASAALLGTSTRTQRADATTFTTATLQHGASLVSERWRSVSHLADFYQIFSQQLSHSASLVLFQPNVPTTPQTYRFTYVDDYGTIYTTTWLTTVDSLGTETIDISTYVEQPYVWGEQNGLNVLYDQSLVPGAQDVPVAGFIQGRELFRRGIITLQRQIIVVESGTSGYTIVDDGNTQYIGNILTSFNCYRKPVDPFRYHIAANTVDEVELPITSGSCFVSPDNPNQSDVVWADVAADGSTSVGTGETALEWVDVWSNPD